MREISAQFVNQTPQRFHNIGSGNGRFRLKTSRAYVAGFGTTGVLIGSFLLLLTVGSTLVAFQGVPGAASNGDLSSIELRQQREAATRSGTDGLLAASNVLGDSAEGSRERGATGDVFGQLASAGRSDPAGNIRQGGSGSSGPGTLRPGTPGTSLGEKAPSTNAPANPPANGVVQTPVDPGALADTPGSGSTGDTGSGTDSGSATDSGGDSGSTGGSTGSGSTGSGSSGSGSTGSGSTDSGSGSDSGTGSSGGSTGTVGDTVEDTTGSAGAAVGTVSPGAGSTATDTGSAVGGLLDDATTAVEGLTGALGTTN